MHAVAVRLFVVASLCSFVPEVARAFDLTGRWQGKWKCVAFDRGERVTRENPNSTADLTQAANEFGALIDGLLAYSGIAIADGENAARGYAGIVHCGSGDDLTQAQYSELGNWKVVTRGAKGALTGTTIWSGHGQHIATCKYRYKRVDTLDPLVATACP